MDYSQENPHQRQEEIAGYFRQNRDEKLKNLNNQEESSCWSETFRRYSEIPQNQQLSGEECSLPKKQLTLNETNLNSNLSRIYNNDLSVSGGYDDNRHTKLKQAKENNHDSFKQVDRILDRSYSDFYSKSNFHLQRQTLDEKNNQTHITGYEKTSKSRFNQSGDIIKIGRMNIQLLTKMKFRLRNFYNKYTIKGRTSRINKEVRTIINDQSDVILLSRQNFITKIFDLSIFSLYFFKKLERIPLFNLQSTTGFFIKLIFTLFNCFFLFAFSLIIIFQGYQQNLSVFKAIVRMIWCIEIFFKANIVQFQTLGTIKKRKKLIINYIKTQAFFDFFPIITLSFTSTNLLYNIIMQLLVYFKIPNVSTDLNYIQKKLCIITKNYYIIQLINLIITIFLIGHIIGCLWYLVGIIELNILELDSTWFGDIRGLNDIWWQYYIWSLYWSITLMTTGSNTANSLLQASYTLFVMLFTTISFAYIVNVIGMILSGMDENNLQKRRDMNIINEYMRQKNITKNLQADVNLDLDYYYQNNFKKMQEDNNSVLEKISEDHKKLLLREYNSQIIAKIPFLSSNFSQEALEELSLFIKEEYFFPNQIIQKETLLQDISIYYIISGSVDLIHTILKDTKLSKYRKTLKENQTFGETSFFTGLSNEIDLRFTDFTKVIKISRDSFINIIKEKEKDFETFCQIRDKLLLYQDHKDLKLSCTLCNSSFHLLNSCPMIHYNKEKEFEKQRILQFRIQNRIQFNRQDRIRCHSISQSKQIQNYAKPICDLIKLQTYSYNRLNPLHNNEESFQSGEDEDDSDQSKNIYIALENLFENQKKQLSEDQSIAKIVQKQESQQIHQNYFENCQKSYRVGLTGESIISVKDLDVLFHNFYFQIIQYLQYLKDQCNIENITAGNKGQPSEQQISIKVPFEKAESSKPSRRLTFENNKSIMNIPDNRTSIVLEVGNIKDVLEIFEQHQGLHQNLKLKIPRKSIMKLNQKQEKTLKDLEQKKDQLKIIPEQKNQFSTTTQQIKSQTLVTSRNSQALCIKGIDNYYEQFEDDSFNPWEFESLKDYKYYFYNGNSKFQIAKQIRYAKRIRAKNKKISSRINK